RPGAPNRANPPGAEAEVLGEPHREHRDVARVGCGVLIEGLELKQRQADPALAVHGRRERPHNRLHLEPRQSPQLSHFAVQPLDRLYLGVEIGNDDLLRRSGGGARPTASAAPPPAAPDPRDPPPARPGPPEPRAAAPPRYPGSRPRAAAGSLRASRRTRPGWLPRGTRSAPPPRRPAGRPTPNRSSPAGSDAGRSPRRRERRTGAARPPPPARPGARTTRPPRARARGAPADRAPSRPPPGRGR